MDNTIRIKIEIGKTKSGKNQTKFESETVEKIEYHVSNMKKIPKDLILKDMARIIKQLNRYRKIKWS